MQDLVASSSTPGAEFTTFRGDGAGGFAPGVVSSGLSGQSAMVAAGDFDRKYVYAGGVGQMCGYFLAADGTAKQVDTSPVSTTTSDTINSMVVDATGAWLLASMRSGVIDARKVGESMPGSIDAVGTRSTAGFGAVDLAFTPDGDNVVVLLDSSNEVQGLAFDRATGGGLTPSAGKTFTVGPGPEHVVVADFGIPGSPFGYAVTNVAGTLTLLSGTASGPTAIYKTIAAADLTGCSALVPIAASDLDNDGDVDIIVGCNRSTASGQRVVILLNDGLANFAAFSV
jgi:DNA-binding beta-propeller fold protein YncE